MATMLNRFTLVKHSNCSRKDWLSLTYKNMMNMLWNIHPSLTAYRNHESMLVASSKRLLVIVGII